MEQVPVYIHIAFALTALLTLYFLYRAGVRSKTILLLLSAWLVLQAVLGLSGFYTFLNAVPPRLLLSLLPPLLLIAFIFLTTKGRRFMDSLDVKMLTLLHVVRILVELVLLGLFMHGAIPKLMTFEGGNFDILSGLTAPLVFYFGFVKRRLGKSFMLVWNFACLALLMNVVVHALLSVPSPLQQFAFTQPNVAILYFPFIWLPFFVVPVVLFAHLVSIRKLLRS